MHDGTQPAPVMSSAAAYLRCYPFDVWRMAVHRRAVSSRAHQLGLAGPEFFMDNGCLSGDPLPELRRMLRLVEARAFDVVLIPGPFVFALDDLAAAGIVRHIEAHDCTVIELPARRALMKHPPAWASEGAPR